MTDVKEYLSELLDQEEKIELAGAPFFSTNFGRGEQSEIIYLHRQRVRGEEVEFGKTDCARASNLEKTAKIYQAQNQAFKEILTAQGFEATENVSKNYEGRIAFLTVYSTIGIFGKPNPHQARKITMRRAYAVRSDINCDGKIGVLETDLKLGERFDLTVLRGRNYQGSALRSLAISSKEIEEEIKEHAEIVSEVARKTVIHLEKL